MVARSSKKTWLLIWECFGDILCVCQLYKSSYVPNSSLNLFTNVKLDHSTICSCSYMFTQFDWHEKNLVTLILKITVFPLCQKIMNFTYKLLSKTKIKNWVLQKLDTVGTQWNAVVVTINSKKLSGHRVQKRWKCPVPCQLMVFLGLVGALSLICVCYD